MSLSSISSIPRGFGGVRGAVTPRPYALERDGMASWADRIRRGRRGRTGGALTDNLNVRGSCPAGNWPARGFTRGPHGRCGGGPGDTGARQGSAVWSPHLCRTPRFADAGGRSPPVIATTSSAEEKSHSLGELGCPGRRELRRFTPAWGFFLVVRKRKRLTGGRGVELVVEVSRRRIRSASRPHALRVLGGVGSHHRNLARPAKK